jgi:hypothetical protein
MIALKEQIKLDGSSTVHADYRDVYMFMAQNVHTYHAWNLNLPAKE